jgi:hypothetical protein
MLKQEIIQSALASAFRKVAAEALAASDRDAGPKTKPTPAGSQQDEIEVLRQAAREKLHESPNEDALAYTAYENPENLAKYSERAIQRDYWFWFCVLVCLALLVLVGIGLVVGSLAWNSEVSRYSGIVVAVSGLIGLLYNRPWETVRQCRSALIDIRAYNIRFLVNARECRKHQTPAQCIKNRIREYQAWVRTLS